MLAYITNRYSKRFFFAATFMIISLTGYAQSDSTVLLKWKLAPHEVITYRTIMQNADSTGAKRFSFNFNKLSGKTGDNKKVSDEVDKLFSELNKSLENSTISTTLAENRKGIIDIEMKMNEQKGTSGKSKDDASRTAQEMLSKMRQSNNNIVLRGAVDESGQIQSFYVKYDQKNLISLFFELPDKPVKVGDTWPMHINFLSADQNFKCDTSYRLNAATLIDVKKRDNETIAVLKCTIVEYIGGKFNVPMGSDAVATTMKMQYNGIAEFSIEKGRWVNYNGLIKFDSDGVMTSHTAQKVAFLPL